MNGTGVIGVVVMVAVGAWVLLLQNNVSNKLSAAVATTVAAQTHTVAAQDQAPEQASEAAVAVQPEPFAGDIIDDRGRRVRKADLNYLLHPERFEYARRVTVTLPIDPASLLKPGEAMPTGEMFGLLIDARSARVSDSVCDMLISTVAARCGVVKYTTSGYRLNGDEEASAGARLFSGMAKVATTALIVPKTEVGTFPDAPTAMLTTRRFNLDDWVLPGPWTASFAPQVDALFEAAEAACATIRDLYGNCVIKGMNADIGGRRLGETGRWFDLAWLAPVAGEAAGEAPAAGSD